MASLRSSTQVRGGRTLATPDGASPDANAERVGTSFAEVIIVLGLLTMTAAAAFSGLTALREERAGREAARGLATDLRRLAHDAQRRRQTMALEFRTGASAEWRVLADGNGNGVNDADLIAGIDLVYRDWSAVFREGRGALDISQDLPNADGDGTISAGSHPVRFGAVPRVTFTARGTGNSGSLYVEGPRGAPYAIRVLGTTQRVRLLCLDVGSGQWRGC